MLVRENREEQEDEKLLNCGRADFPIFWCLLHIIREAGRPWKQCVSFAGRAARLFTAERIRPGCACHATAMSTAPTLWRSGTCARCFATLATCGPRRCGVRRAIRRCARCVTAKSMAWPWEQRATSATLLTASRGARPLRSWPRYGRAHPFVRAARRMRSTWTTAAAPASGPPCLAPVPLSRCPTAPLPVTRHIFIRSELPEGCSNLLKSSSYSLYLNLSQIV